MMKTNNRIFIYAFILLLLSIQSLIAQEPGNKVLTFPILLEAESADYSGLTVKGDAGASNGQYLAMGETGSVTWTFSVVDSGWYKIHIGYRNTKGESVNPLIQNGVEWSEGFGWSSNWNIHEKLIALHAGENTVQLAANYGIIDIDYLEVDTTTLLPMIKPSFNNYYLKSPRMIKLNMHAYGRTISTIKAEETDLDFTLTPYPFLEDTWEIMISDASLSGLAAGAHSCSVNFDNGDSVPFKLEVFDDAIPSLLTIIAPHIEHGNSVIVLLPTGKTMLIDCGEAVQRDKVVIPLLHKLNISKLDYFILTHYHEDHDGGDGGATIKTEFDVQTFYDYKSFSPGDVLEVGNTRIKILNAYSGPDENQSSLCFKLEYNGFIYVHGGDIYATQQRNIMSQFPADVKAHVYSANHHFHGSSDPEYMRLMDPYLVFIQAQEAIYARSTYTQVFQIQTAEWLRKNHKRFLDELPCKEIGTAVIRANSADDWTYETYGDSLVPTIPYLQQNMQDYEGQVDPPEFTFVSEDSVSTYLKETEVEIHTNKTAYLRYATENISYDDMVNEFEVGQGIIFHQTMLKGKQAEAVNFYIRAKDRYGNESVDPAVITIETDTLAIPMMWYEKEYDDSDWKSGAAPIGYGNEINQTAIQEVTTFYMRKDFILPEVFTTMGLLIKGFDGMAAYVNGHQVARINLPDITDYSSFAVDKPTNPYASVKVFDAAAQGSLQSGENTVAIEVHSADITEKSVSLDARVFNGEAIYSDLGENWVYYDAGNDPPIQTLGEATAIEETRDPGMPGDFSLIQNYPNPFNPSTTISFNLKKTGLVKINIYDVKGSLVDTILNKRMSFGTHSIQYDATNLASGKYFYRLEFNGKMLTRDMILLK